MPSTSSFKTPPLPSIPPKLEDLVLTPKGNKEKERMKELSKQFQGALKDEEIVETMYKEVKNNPTAMADLFQAKESKGKAIKKIMEKIQVILGSKQAGNNADRLEELTALLGELLDRKVIDTRKYSYFLDQYKKE